MTQQLNSFNDFLTWETSTRDTIDVKCIYIDIAQGDHVAGILLSQIVYWHLPSRRDNKTKLRVKKKGQLWLAKGRNDWYDETRITPRQFDRASKILVDLGIIEKKVFKFSGNPTVHVRINQETFLNALAYHMTVAIDASIEAEDEFADDEEHLIGLVEDSGTSFHGNREPVPASAFLFDPPASDDLEAEISKSPNGENHNREKDVLSSSLRSEERTLSPNPKDKKEKCTRCATRNSLDAKFDIRGRCAVCLFVDAWAAFVGVRTPAYSVDNDRREYIGVDNIRLIKTHMMARLKDAEFRKGWVFALERAGHMEHLKESGFFTPEYFLRNGANWRKVVDGTFDGFEEQNHAASYARLQSWLARKRAGLAD